MTLQAALTPPTPGDTCAVAIPLSFPTAGGTVQVTGTLADAFDDDRSDCATIYADRVYTFTTTQATNLIAEATTSTGLKAPILTLRSGTCEGPSVMCTYGGDTQSFIRNKNLPPGTYFLFVEKSNYNAPEDYALKVTLKDQPPGDLCVSALPLGLPASGSGEVTVQGDTRPFFDDLVPICGSSSGPGTAPDTLYTFTTTTVMNLRMYVKALSSGFRPTLSLRKGCGANDFDMRCEATPSYADDTWTSYRKLPAGTYYFSASSTGMTPPSGSVLLRACQRACPPRSRWARTAPTPSR